MLDPIVLPPYVVADLYRRPVANRRSLQYSQTIAGIKLPLDWFNQWREVASLGHKAFLRCSGKYFAAPENQDLGVVKYQRKTEQKIDLSPSPGSQRPPEKFHHPTLLTNCSSPKLVTNEVVVSLLLLEVERTRPLLKAFGQYRFN